MQIEITRKVKLLLDDEERCIIEKAMVIMEEIQMALQDNECDCIEDDSGCYASYNRLEEALDILSIVKNMEEMY